MGYDGIRRSMAWGRGSRALGRTACGLLALALVCLLPASVWAATYHVAPNGSDGADGSAASPWASLQHAADQVAAGDVVEVAAGSYAGFIIQTSGTASERIEFSAAAGVVVDTPNDDGEGITFSNVDYVTISGFTVQDIPDIGIAGHDATATEPMVGNHIVGCRVVNVVVVGMYVSQFSFSLIEGNEITGTQPENDFNGHGMYVANAGCDDTIIRGNNIHHNVTGIHFNGDLSIGGDGIISRLQVEGNIIAYNENNGLNMDGVQDSLVQNNLIIGNGRHGVRDYAIDAAAGARGMTVVNNTILVPSGGGWCVRFTEDDGGGHVVFNNILLNDGGEGAISVEGSDLVQADHNVVTPVFSVSPDESHIDLAGWQGLGHGPSTTTASAAELFVDPGGDDYHLVSDAPAVDQGVLSAFGVDAPLWDLDGRLRPVGAAIDQGTYEYCEGDECEPAGDAGPGPPDASAGGSGGSGGSGGTGTGGAGGAPPPGAVDGGDDGGCSCRMIPGTATVAATPLLLVLLWRLRRRRS